MVKNSRKEFYKTEGNKLKAGDIVCCGSKTGHDVGIVSLTQAKWYVYR